MASDSFGTQKRPTGKQFRDGTVGEALDDLYSDIDDAFAVAEQTGATQRIVLHLDEIPTAGDTLTCGNDVYEFLGAAGATANATNIAVFIGDPASIPTTYANLQAAMAGEGDPAGDGLTGPMGADLADVQLNGTENVRLANIGANDADLIMVDDDGDEQKGLPEADIALEDNLTDAGDGWCADSIQAASTSSTGSRSCVVNFVYDAENVVAGKTQGVKVILPFLPTAHTCSAKVTATGVDVATAGTAIQYATVSDEHTAVIDVSGGVLNAMTADGSEDITVVFFE